MRRRDVLAGLAAVAGLAALGGCAARGPDAATALHLAPPLAPDRARLIFVVPSDPGVILVGEPNVFVNRRKVGRMVRAGVFWTDVVPGRQTISTSAELSHALLIQAAPGETLYIELGDASGTGAAWALQATQPRLLTAEEGASAITGKRLIHLMP